MQKIYKIVCYRPNESQNDKESVDRIPYVTQEMGWMWSIDQAIIAVLQNRGDINDCWYHHCCIKESSQGVGIGNFDKQVQWFQFRAAKGKRKVTYKDCKWRKITQAPKYIKEFLQKMGWE